MYSPRADLKTVVLKHQTFYSLTVLEGVSRLMLLLRFPLLASSWLPVIVIDSGHSSVCST